MANFSNFVFDVNTENPPQIGDFAPSLSGSNNTVIYVPNDGVVGDKSVAGLLYNELSAGGANTMSSLSVAIGVSFRVEKRYHGSKFALYFTDRSSTLFTVNTGISLQSVTEPNGFSNRGPNERKRFAVEL